MDWFKKKEPKKYNVQKCELTFKFKDFHYSDSSVEVKGRVVAPESSHGWIEQAEERAYTKVIDIYQRGFIASDKRFIPASEIKEIIKNISDYWVNENNEEVAGE